MAPSFTSQIRRAASLARLIQNLAAIGEFSETDLRDLVEATAEGQALILETALSEMEAAEVAA